MFELTKDEFDSLRCNFFTSNTRGGNRYLPFAFTREGIAMLSGLLRSPIAIQANINIMRAFFQMQEALLIVSNTQLQLEQIRSEIRQLRTDMNDTLADQKIDLIFCGISCRDFCLRCSDDIRKCFFEKPVEIMVEEDHYASCHILKGNENEE